MKTSSEITGLPPHRFNDVKFKQERRGWDTRRFTVRRHAPDCERCAAERATAALRRGRLAA